MRAKEAGIVLVPRSFFSKLYDHEVKFVKLSFIFVDFLTEYATVLCILFPRIVNYNAFYVLSCFRRF